jgi:hypothetical protein
VLFASLFVQLFALATRKHLALNVARVAAFETSKVGLSIQADSTSSCWTRPPTPPRSRLDSDVGVYVAVVGRAAHDWPLPQILRDGVTDRRRLTSLVAEA